VAQSPALGAGDVDDGRSGSRRSRPLAGSPESGGARQPCRGAGPMRGMTRPPSGPALLDRTWILGGQTHPAVVSPPRPAHPRGVQRHIDVSENDKVRSGKTTSRVSERRQPCQRDDPGAAAVFTAAGPSRLSPPGCPPGGSHKSHWPPPPASTGVRPNASKDHIQRAGTSIGTSSTIGPDRIVCLQEGLPGGGQWRLPDDGHFPTLRSVPWATKDIATVAIYQH
jgi:hypothetical protein